MADHPDWNFDNSGNAVVPADAPMEHTALVAEIANSDRPSQASVPATRDGNVLAKSKSIDGIPREDWSKPRDESGRYVTNSADELRKRWADEGGYAFNLQRAGETTRWILALAGDEGDALAASVDALPSQVQPYIHDLLRIQPTGNPKTTDRILTERLRAIPQQHKAAVNAWIEALTDNQHNAIFSYFDGKRR